MTRLRLGLTLASCAIGAVAASAAETSISKTVAGAFNTVIIQATTAATTASKAADEALQPTAKKKSKNAKASKEKGQDGKPAEADKGGPQADDKAAGTKGDAKTDAKQDPKSADKNSGDKAKAADPKAAADAAKAGDGKPNDKAGGKPGDTAATKPPPEPTEWPATDIELAKARCTQLLKTVNAVTVPEAPFRQGECGAPAPVRLISLGRNPEVSFSPPALVTCDMVVALHKWIKEDVQPLSRKYLGGQVIKIETMSDYSCRKAYGRVANKLSEHGKANALDIRGFVTNKGQEAVVLTAWGQTRRDLERQIAAAKVAAQKAEALKAAAEAEQARLNAATTKTALETAGRRIDTQASVPRATIIEGVPGVAMEKDSGFGFAPTRLGGPKEEKAKDKRKSKREEAGAKAAKQEAVAKAADDIDEATPAAPGMVVAPVPAPNPTTAFLRDAHDAACQIFGTTLGPEANDAHRNHFHVDMAERKVKKICD